MSSDINDTDSIYRDELLDLYKNPVHKGDLHDASHSHEEHNSLCGDILNVKIKVDDGIIKDMKFTGDACAVSLISAELVADEIIGKSVKYALSLTKDALLNMLNVNLTTSRIKCATLILDALHGALDIYTDSENHK